MKLTILLFTTCLGFVACKTTQHTTASTTTAYTSTPQPMHATPPTQLENTPPITSPMLIGTWELDSLIADGQAVSMSNYQNKNTMQFTGAGLMVVKGSDQKEKFLTYTYKDSKITTLEDPNAMYVKSLNARSLVLLVNAEGREVRMVYKKK